MDFRADSFAVLECMVVHLTCLINNHSALCHSVLPLWLPGSVLISCMGNNSYRLALKVDQKGFKTVSHLLVCQTHGFVLFPQLHIFYLQCPLE